MQQEPEIISHLKKDDTTGEWRFQSNSEHVAGVAALASAFADRFGFGSWGRVLGLLHDRGKERQDFQRYIRFRSGYRTDVGTWGDKSHAMTGAKIAREQYPGSGWVLANAIAGHHRGLYDDPALEKEIGDCRADDVDRSGTGTELTVPAVCMDERDMQHLTRMLFSCLVDADYLDTERFMNVGQSESRGQSADMAALRDMMADYIKSFADKPRNAVNQLRDRIQKQCVEMSTHPPGFFSLTVPTGGGKTIASVLWALNHAVANGKRRVIIAIPYTSIIVQTAQTLREILGAENVLEHHSVVDEENMSERSRLAAENWDAPVVVTTNVRLFESMFSNRPGACRKLHSLCDSVVILDEAQSLPRSLLQPVTDAMRTYAKMFGVSFLLCTASQPVLDGDRKGSGMAVFHGLESDSIREITDGDDRLHDKLRRVGLKFLPGRIAVDALASRLSGHGSVLCVVNTRSLALKVFSALPDDGARRFHLSRMMCPAHIRHTIDEIKKALRDEDGRAVRVVSTQLIEAGVDIDFPVVYRQLAGLDSVVQAAGRCNREGRMQGIATAYVFEAEGEREYGQVAAATDALRSLLSVNPDRDWFDPAVMREYNRVLYSKTPSFDAPGIGSLSGNPVEIYYEEIAGKFRMIDDSGVSVIVNYGKAPELVERLRQFGPSRSLMRELGQYTVSVNRRQFSQFVDAGLIEWPTGNREDGICYIPLADQYDPVTGLKTNNEYLEQSYII